MASQFIPGRRNITRRMRTTELAGQVTTTSEWFVLDSSTQRPWTWNFFCLFSFIFPQCYAYFAVLSDRAHDSNLFPFTPCLPSLTLTVSVSWKDCGQENSGWTFSSTSFLPAAWSWRSFTFLLCPFLHLLSENKSSHMTVRRIKWGGICEAPDNPKIVCQFPSLLPILNTSYIPDRSSHWSLLLRCE